MNSKNIVKYNRNAVPDYLKVWLLRIIEVLGGYSDFIGTNGYQNELLAKAIGLRNADTEINGEFNFNEARHNIHQAYERAEQLCDSEIPNSILTNNISKLAKLAGLTSVDIKILVFAVHIHCEQLLEDAAELLNNLSVNKVHYVLSVILDIPEPAIKQALSTNGLLSKTGLLSVDKRYKTTLINKLDLPSFSFAELVSSEESDPVYLLREMVSLSTPPELCINDYSYMKESLDILQPYLLSVSALCKKGVNILLFGEPGTGKTQLAKVLAKELDCELFDVACEDLDGDSVNGKSRLRAYRASQSFFAKRKALIAFEEVEDIFGGGELDMVFGGASKVDGPSKAWLNNMLESNNVPTIWLSNSVDGIDSAYIRRFDMVIEMSVPPKRKRENIIRETCGDMLTSKAIAQLSNEKKMSPAVIKRAASVIRCIKNELPEEKVSQSIKHIVESTMRAQGSIEMLSSDADILPNHFSLEYINSTVDLAQIANGLKECSSGKICFYGPSGTGKTAYCRWLADNLGLSLILKKGSDLLSPFIGMAEKNIAQAFREATQDNAILMIDEVDTFLQDRRNSNHSWEISQVNEFLTQLESYSGVFIASTNLMDGLDQAALRRFDLKTKFDYLQPSQAWSMYKQHCDMMGFDIADRDLQAKVKQLNALTPGDFAAVSRQNHFHPLKNAEDRRISSQLSPHVNNYAALFTFCSSFCFSGLRNTSFTGSQFLISPLQRSGFLAFACL